MYSLFSMASLIYNISAVFRLISYYLISSSIVSFLRSAYIVVTVKKTSQKTPLIRVAIIYTMVICIRQKKSMIQAKELGDLDA